VGWQKYRRGNAPCLKIAKQNDDYVSTRLRAIEFGAFQRGRSERQAKVSQALTFFAGFLVKQKTGTDDKVSPLSLSHFLTRQKTRRKNHHGH
jgi:hypothetical protein